MREKIDLLIIYMYMHTRIHIHPHIHIYVGHSINKVTFVKGFGNRKHYLQLHLFQGNQ